MSSAEKGLYIPPTSGLRTTKSLKISVVQMPFFPASSVKSFMPAAEVDGLIGNWILGERGSPNGGSISKLGIEKEWMMVTFSGFFDLYKEWYVRFMDGLLKNPNLKSSDIILFPEYSIMWDEDDEKIKKINENLLELSEGKCIVGGIGLSKVNGELKNKFVVLNGEPHFGEKFSPNPDELGFNVMPGKGELVFDVPIGVDGESLLFAVLMCSDLPSAQDGWNNLWGEIDSQLKRRGYKRDHLRLILCPAVHPSIETLHERTNPMAIENHTIVAVANTSFFGGSRIICKPLDSGRSPLGIFTHPKGQCSILTLEIPVEYVGYPSSSTNMREKRQTQRPEKPIEIKTEIRFGTGSNGEDTSNCWYIDMESFYEHVFRRVGIAISIGTIEHRLAEPEQLDQASYSMIDTWKKFQDLLLPKIPGSSPYMKYHYSARDISDMLVYMSIKEENIIKGLIESILPFIDKELQGDAMKIQQWLSDNPLNLELLTYKTLFEYLPKSNGIEVRW